MSALDPESVHFGEVPVIRHTNEMPEAAANLVTRMCAYVLPETIESPYAPVTDNEQKINALINALNKTHPGWVIGTRSERTVDRQSDIGMHANPPIEEPGILDYLQYHWTPRGSHDVTLGLARPAYWEEHWLAEPLLTAALRDGQTIPRYADPATFQRASIPEGAAVVFRLNGPEGESMLHDFLTTSDERVAEITRLQRIDPNFARTPARRTIIII